MADELCISCPYRQVDAVESLTRGDRWTAYLGDSTALLRTLADRQPGTVDAVITDPPYGTGANTIAGRLSSTVKKYSGAKTVMPAFAGDSVTPDVWEKVMRDVLRLSLALAKPGADALVFCDWRGYPSIMRIVGSVGWGVRGVVVWDKGRGARPTPNGFRAQHELIIWARNGHAQRRDPPVYLDGVLRHATPPRKYHQVEKPLELMRYLVQVCPPGGTVLDPFQGSGTTGVAALMEGRRYIGIEMMEHYHRVACERLKQAEAETLKAVREGLHGG